MRWLPFLDAFKHYQPHSVHEKLLIQLQEIQDLYQHQKYDKSLHHITSLLLLCYDKSRLSPDPQSKHYHAFPSILELFTTCLPHPPEHENLSLLEEEEVQIYKSCIPWLLVKRSFCFIKLNEIDKARRDLEYCLALSKKNLLALAELANLLSLFYEQFSKARSLFDQIDLTLEHKQLNFDSSHGSTEMKSILETNPEALLDYEVILDLKFDSIRYHKQKTLHFSLFNQYQNHFFIHSLKAGQDFACHASPLHPIQSLIYRFAKVFQNLIHVVGCLDERKCVIIDLCWDPDSIVKHIKDHHMSLEALILTHTHFDHIGGRPPAPFDQYGIHVKGAVSLLQHFPDLKIYLHENDLDMFLKANPECPLDSLHFIQDSETVFIGKLKLQFFHMPGHTPGSINILLNGLHLFTGDLLFHQIVGRMDLPESEPTQMFNSLQKLKSFNDDIFIYPGHFYNDASLSTLKWEKENNPFLLPNEFNHFLSAVYDHSFTADSG